MTRQLRSSEAPLNGSDFRNCLKIIDESRAALDLRTPFEAVVWSGCRRLDWGGRVVAESPSKY